MQRFKKFIYYPFIHAWRELQGGHPFGMFRTCLEGFFKGSFFHVRPEKGRGVFQFFRNTTDKFAVLFRLALTHMPSFKREPVVGGGKQLTCSLAPSGVVHPLRGYRFTALSGGKSAMSNNLSHGTVIDSPKPTQIPVAPKFAEISEFHGITDIHAFNGFNSFYDFLRKTFFHTRYVLVTGKDTEKVSMPVYNLSVNKDESYVLPIGIVHNCRCTVVQVRKDKYPLSDETQAMNLGSQATAGKHQEMFMYNPGKKMTTFPAYNAYTRKACIECPYSGGSIKLAKVPDNELCRACEVVRRMVNKEKTVKLSKEERLQIRNAVNEWADRHLKEETLPDGTIAKRLYLINDETGNRIVVNKSFFGETFAKNIKNKRLAMTMELATKANEWLPDAKYVREEDGTHHEFKFDVYQTEYNDMIIEFKVKKTSEMIIYNMRLL